VQSALLSFGPIALETLGVVLGNRSSPRPLRVHIPNSIARFGTKRAAEILLTTIEIDFDGLVRYKSIRALGRLVADHRVRVDPIRVERLAYENTVEHFRLLGLLAALDPAPLHLPTGIVRREVTEKLLLGLLHDKLRQSLERTFRLLKIANPDEDFHRVHMAFLSEDRRARANAAEFLDVLLRKRDQERLRELLRISAEEVSVADQIARAASLLREEPPPSTREGALERLAQDGDATLSALAQLHAAAVSGRPARVVIGSREGASIELALEERAERLITEAQHA
jgi:hypothetical protein